MRNKAYTKEEEEIISKYILAYNSLEPALDRVEKEKEELNSYSTNNPNLEYLKGYNLLYSFLSSKLGRSKEALKVKVNKLEKDLNNKELEASSKGITYNLVEELEKENNYRAALKEIYLKVREVEALLKKII